MSEKNEIYKCSKCGHIIEINHEAAGTLVCCGVPMNRQGENTTDAAVEKHVPVVSKIDGGYKVVVGEVNHPMGKDHFIEWIELLAGNKSYKQFLNPGDSPEATFMIDADDVIARAYCNLHGQWKNS